MCLLNKQQTSCDNMGHIWPHGLEEKFDSWPWR